MNQVPLTPLQRSVVLTLTYSDIFDHPLTLEEVHRFLVLVTATKSEVAEALTSLEGRLIWQSDGYFGLLGREANIATRERRARYCRGRWDSAQEFATWLARVPFVRMVAVCGSQAVENGDTDGDVDFFLIARGGRLWIVQVLTMLLRRVAHRRLGHMCPNHFMTTTSLDATRRDLYTAREIAQVVPLWGEAEYDNFVEANSWVAALLPHATGAAHRERLRPRSASRWARGFEWLLGGIIGHALDQVLHRLLLLYYPIRLRRRGLRTSDVEAAYRRDRQTVIAGGYSIPVEHAFRARVQERLGEVEEMKLLFPASPEAKAHPVYSQLLAEHYGGGVV
jgi:hypothetical protein